MARAWAPFATTTSDSPSTRGICDYGAAHMPLGRRGGVRVSIVIALSAGLLAVVGLRWPLTAHEPVTARPAVAPHVSLVTEDLSQLSRRRQEKGGPGARRDSRRGRDPPSSGVGEVVRKLRARQMPPLGEPRPADAAYDAAIDGLVTVLDRAARAKPSPGRTATIRRLTGPSTRTPFAISSRSTWTWRPCCPRTNPVTASTT